MGSVVPCGLGRAFVAPASRQKAAEVAVKRILTRKEPGTKELGTLESSNEDREDPSTRSYIDAGNIFDLRLDPEGLMPNARGIPVSGEGCYMLCCIWLAPSDFIPQQIMVVELVLER